MITAIMAAHEMHAVYVIKREGMAKIRAKGFCSVEEDAGPGVYQVPDWAFDGRPKFGETPVCAKCAAIIGAMEEPPK
jgi:hypothetical protein